MRTLAASLLLLPAFTVQSQVINQSNFSFNPNLLTVQAGTEITINIGATHTFTQVSEATWNANGNTPLGGGFNFNSGTHQLTLTVPGTYYYVCVPHANMGMKGRIVVEVNTDVADAEPVPQSLVFPNPADRFLIVEGTQGGEMAQLFDAQGREVLRHAVAAEGRLDVTSVPAGAYVLRLNDQRGGLLTEQRVVIAH
ncbi:MAG: T9SS type A sorting domain-containing protein [Flavobacteriales bacterium]|nr:T9SS type A sorting domain-containing protein [Flavobacteriales bacterium]